MDLFQQLKNSLAGKATVPLLSGATTNGVFAEQVIAAVRRTVLHPLTEGAVLLAGSQYIAAAVGLVTSVVTARLLGPKDFGLVAVVMSYPMLLGSLVAVKSGTVTTSAPRASAPSGKPICSVLSASWATLWIFWFPSWLRC